MIKPNGIIEKLSRHSVDETVEGIKTILSAKGITVFAVIDHSGEAEKAGMTMLPSKLLIFGSPKAGTPMMLAAPTVALDLPLKILISEDNSGDVWASCSSAEYLAERHDLPEDFVKDLGAAESIVAKPPNDSNLGCQATAI